MRDEGNAIRFRLNRNLKFSARRRKGDGYTGDESAAGKRMSLAFAVHLAIANYQHHVYGPGQPPADVPREPVGQVAGGPDPVAGGEVSPPSGEPEGMNEEPQ
jgi:hypothetical protein